MKIDNKNFDEISYRFFDIRGKGYCPIEITTYDIVAKDIKVLTAGRFLAKGCVISIAGDKVLPVKCDIIFHTYEEDQYFNLPDWGHLEQTISYPTIGIAMTGSVEGDMIEVAISPDTYNCNSYLESDDADCLVHEDELHDP